MNKTIIIIFLISLSLAQKDCLPFGTRVQYGKHLVSKESTEKVVVSFNTEGQCPQSFLELIGKGGYQLIHCSSLKIVASQLMEGFTTYVHKCPFVDFSFDTSYNYKVYGWANRSSQIRGQNSWVALNVVDPSKSQHEANILCLADWSVIKTTGFTPIADSLRKIIKEESLKLIMLNGDIAYDLDSNGGQNYLDFLKMIEQFTSQIPIVFVPGNHQHYSPDDILLFSQTFQLYNVLQKLAIGFQFKDLYIIPYDPYRIAKVGLDDPASLSALKDQLSIAKKTNLFTIPFSHYSLICGGQAENCQSIFSRMGDYYNAMIDGGASLYIGAHAHQYQRIYPYFSDGTFKKIESPYRDDQNYLISIVEGVAGSETDLVTSMDQIYDYTASYTVNQTGFGILKSIPNNKVVYKHYSTKRGYTDSISIQKRRISDSSRLRQNKLLTEFI